MFRIKISYTYNNGYITEVRLKTKNFTKGFTCHMEMIGYRLRCACREIIRDELYCKYNDSWMRYEQQKQIALSIRSAINRMKQVNSY